MAAGARTARALSSSLAVLGIVLGIWEVVGGAKKILNGSKLAQEFRESYKDLESESAKLIQFYKELQ